MGRNRIRPSVTQMPLARRDRKRFHGGVYPDPPSHDAFIPACPAARHPCRLLHSWIRHRRVGAVVPYAKAKAGLTDASLGAVLLCLGLGSLLAMPLAVR